MIKARGFKSSFAGGVEAAASSGGQFMPPVMGAVAFVMADFTGIPYIIIIAAALMPALFYYGSLFIAVWVEAARQGITSIPKEEREVLIREDWIKSLMFFVPVLVIIAVCLYPRGAEERQAYHQEDALRYRRRRHPHGGRGGVGIN